MNSSAAKRWAVHAAAAKNIAEQIRRRIGRFPRCV